MAVLLDLEHLQLACISPALRVQTRAVSRGLRTAFDVSTAALVVRAAPAMHVAMVF